MLSFHAHIELPEMMSIPSVNVHSRPARTASGFSYMYKPDTVRKFQKELTQQLEESPLVDVREYSVSALSVGFIFHFRKRFWNRDCSNMIKSCEDVVANIIECNDNRVTRISGEKVYIVEKSRPESIDVTIELLEYEPKEDQERVC